MPRAAARRYTRPRRGRLHLAVALGLGLLAGCREESVGEAPQAQSDVSGSRIAALEAECGPLAHAQDAIPSPASIEELAADVLELAAVVAEGAELGQLALTDIQALGAPAEAAAARGLRDEQQPLTTRIGCATVLGTFDSEFGAGALLEVLEAAHTAPLLRAHCAFALERGTQDWSVPRLVRRLRYETDREAWIFVARALARFENFAGLEGLLEIVGSPAEDERWRNEADALLWQLATEREFESPELLAWHWQIGNVDGRIPPELSSVRQRLEVWRFVHDLGDFQLRPVDDGRFVLSHLGVVAAHALADALRDESPHVRLHSAQTLARMGPRAMVAGSALIEALDDPEAGAQAAQALGKIGVPAAEAALTERLGAAHPLALRVACAEALGWIGSPSSSSALLPLLDPREPVDLRAAAAAGLLRTQPAAETRQAVALLLELFDEPRLDPARPEAELGAWLERTARGDSLLAADAGELLQRWNELDSSTASGPQDQAALSARRTARRALLSTALSELAWR